MLGSSGIEVEPETLASLVYLPKKRGSLQIELLSAARRHRRLPYQIDPNLEDILAELRAGRPVLVFQNLGIRLIPVWHYAVVVGYDPVEDRVFLRSGKTKRRVMSGADFMDTWERADKWAMVVLEPGQMPVNPDPVRFLSSASAMESVGSTDLTLQWMDAAAEQWPQNALVQFALGNALYENGRAGEAVETYRLALSLDPGLLVARNNLAHVLQENGCADEALVEINRALQADGEMDSGLRETLLETKAEIEKNATPADGAAPGLCRQESLRRSHRQ